MGSVREFDDWMAEHPAETTLFRDYCTRSFDLITQLQATLTALSIDFAGRAVLDIGPGFGECVDTAYRGGAKSIDFIELDPVFFHYNRVKGYGTGHRMNHTLFPARRVGGSYDIVWCRGSVVADLFDAHPHVHAYWLRQVAQMCRGAAIVVPYFCCGDGERSNVDPYASRLADTFRSFGFHPYHMPSDLMGAKSYPVVYAHH